MRVVYHGVMGAHTSYSQVAQDYCKALLLAGVELGIDPLPEEKSEGWEPGFEHLDPLVEGPNQPATHAILHCPPWAAKRYLCRIGATKKILMTTWETDRLLPETTKEINESFDLVIVPSTWNKRIFEETGITVPVMVIPHAMDTELWGGPRTYPQGPLYEFYSVLTWCLRKNPVGLLTAYITEFEPDEPVRLKLYCKDANPHDIDNLNKLLQIPRWPRIEVITKQQKWIPKEEYRQGHADGHCYVTASHSEGWGIPLFEAAAMGNTVITPRYGGFTDFLNTYYRAKYVGGQLAPAMHRWRGYSGKQCWFDPDLMGIRYHMRRAFTYRYEWQDASNIARAEFRTMLKLHSHINIGEKLRSVLETV